MRTLIIGEIHGADIALNQCLERANFDFEKDQLIALGDFVDGWENTYEVIETLLKVKNFIGIMGNHDLEFLDWIETGVNRWGWKHGSDATARSYAKHAGINLHIENGIANLNIINIPQSHIKFFKSLHYYYVDDENRGFVHGGFISKLGLGNDPHPTDYCWDRDMWHLALGFDGNENIGLETTKSQRFRKHKEVFIGHTATTNWKYKWNGVLRIMNGHNKVGQTITTPIQACNVWNLDTGAGWNGKLTIMDVDTKKYWQSDLVQEIFPSGGRKKR